MPFGRHRIGKTNVDFDRIYDKVFKPAIEGVRVSGKTCLVPIRADRSHLGHLGMLRYLLRSRLAIADISIQRTNVGDEAGLRRGLRRGSPQLVHHAGTAIPFNYQLFHVFEYYRTPPAKARESREKIADVLEERLKTPDEEGEVRACEFLDSLGTDEHPTELGEIVISAERDAASGKLDSALQGYRRATRMRPDLAAMHQRYGMLLRDVGKDNQALKQFKAAARLTGEAFAPALRELGFTQKRLGNPDAAKTLEKVLKLDPQDLEASAVLGDVKLQQLADTDFARAAMEKEFPVFGLDRFIDVERLSASDRPELYFTPWNMPDGDLICHVMANVPRHHDSEAFEKVLRGLAITSHVEVVSPPRAKRDLRCMHVKIEGTPSFQQRILGKAMDACRKAKIAGKTPIVKFGGPGGFGTGGGGGLGGGF
jgi:tetratricopeptide (TPR) repeat protein